MELKDIPGAAKVGGAFGAIVDVLSNGGELIAFFVLGLVDTIDLWVPFLGNLVRAAPSLAWLPKETVGSLLTVVVLASAARYGYRIVASLSNRFRSQNENES